MHILLLCTILTASPNEIATQSLLQADKDFAAMADEAGYVKAFEYYVFPNGVLFQPGPMQLTTWLENNKGERGRLQWQPNLSDAAVAGDLGYTSGPWVYTSADGKKNFGHYLTVWQKNHANAYQVIVDIGINHPEPSGAATKPECIGVAGITDDETGFEEEKLKLEKADQNFLREAKKSGLIEAYLTFTEDSLKRFVSGSFPVSGQVEVLKTFKNTRSEESPEISIPVQFEVLGFDLSESKEFGYTFGKILFPEGNKATDRYYLRIWKKSDSGEWLVAVEVMT